MLTEIARAVGTLCGGGATIVDTSGAVVASSGVDARDEDARVRPAAAAVEAADAAGRPLRVAAGVFGPLGYVGAVVVSATGAPLPDGALAVVEDAARVTARYLSLYRSRDAAAAPGDAPYVVAAFAGGTHLNELAEHVRAAWHARGPVSCDMGDGVVYAVTTDTRTAVPVARHVVQAVEHVLRVPVHAGVGPVFAGLESMAEARHVASQVLRAVVRRGRARVAGLDEVRADVLLVALRDAAGELDLPSGLLAPLTDYDERHGTEYVATLRAYLDAFGDVADAAEHVRVHPRTFRYRLRRVKELSGIRLDDAAERLAAQLELHLVDRC